MHALRQGLFAWLLLTVPHLAAATPADTLNDTAWIRRLRSLSAHERDEVVWLARCIYSESDRPHEQRLVAWVVRNRVETGYRGSTYREVVLEDKQFSAFNDPTPRRAHILSLDLRSRSPAWRRTLRIALEVYLAPSSKNPFTPTTRHFYSPISMKGRTMPDWARGAEPLNSRALGVDPHRFLFFDNVDEQGVESFATDNEPAVSRSSGESSITRSRLRRLRPFSGRVPRPRRPSVSPPRRGQ